MHLESKLLWWNAHECQLQIRELMSSANPCIGSPNVTLYCCAKLIWQLKSGRVCPAKQLDLSWSGTVVWFCVPSRFRPLDTSRKRLLKLHKRKIGLLFQPGACELTSGKSRSHAFHRIFPARASSAIDLIVNVNSQDSTQASWRANVQNENGSIGC